MALRGLVEGECGTANPLVQWTSHFSQEKAVLKGGLRHDRLEEIARRGDTRVAGEQWVDDFLGEHRPAVPQTYNMAELLHEMQSIQHPQHPPHLSMHEDARVKEWVQEYAPPHHPPVATQDAWGGLVRLPESEWVQEFSRGQEREANEWAREFAPTEEEKWVEEYEKMRMGGDLASVAREMADTVTDPNIQATEFMDFVKKLATGELKVDDDDAVASGTTKAKDWAQEFLKQDEQEKETDFWERLERGWEEMAKQEDHPWLTDYDQFQRNPEYQFQKDNPLKDTSNPLEEGLKKLKDGDLPSAVLLFEAEVQARPDSIEGWQYLGTTQADNEQELAAIAALQKCLELDPTNLPATMALAVSYTNESQQMKALDALKDWLRCNPKYSSLVPQGAEKADHRPLTSSFMTKEEHAAVKDLYLNAAQISPEQVDPNVQVGLGVLFNLSNEYDKAVDCFSAALAVKPDDAMLWNKLGATLANGNRSEEAIHAYRQALHYLPGFTRCRYNLGISCINLKAYKEAIEHFLTALHLQRQAKGPEGARGVAQMSESIWSTLRLAVTFLGRSDVREKLEARELDFLMKEFGVD